LTTGADVARRLDAGLLEERRRWRLAGQRLVFANGCFDLLHLGHLQLLEEARAQGEVLVVGINSDASVRQLKGPDRPLFPESERAEVLLALEAVDRVVVFDQPTPLELIQALLPDVLVKGADWDADNIVGRDVVEAHGGRVVRVALMPERSTTRLLAQIRHS